MGVGAHHDLARQHLTHLRSQDVPRPVAAINQRNILLLGQAPHENVVVGVQFVGCRYPVVDYEGKPLPVDPHRQPCFLDDLDSNGGFGVLGHDEIHWDHNQVPNSDRTTGFSAEHLFGDSLTQSRLHLLSRS